MRTGLQFAALAAFLVGIGGGVLAETSVTNVAAAQRSDGTEIVDIRYDVASSDSPDVFVSVKVSLDGGATYAVVPTHVTGDVGGNVPVGAGKQIVWDCSQDLARGTSAANVVACVTAFGRGGEMIYIPAGSFLMGNNGSEPYSYNDEFPQHSVYLSGYWIGKYEVTRGEYRRFMQATGRAAPAYWEAYQDWSYPYDDGNGFTQTDDHPVVGVTWYDAEAYCAWAGGQLPTEAQWEKAARWTGSYPNVYPWGNAWDAERCNNSYDTNPAGGGYQGCQTAPAGSYPLGASPYGLQDMAGNVWEWCRDWYSFSFYSVSPSEDPQGPSSGSYRVLRGGSWYSSTGSYGSGRCAVRDSGYPTGYWTDGGGFRLAR